MRQDKDNNHKIIDNNVNERDLHGGQNLKSRKSPMKSAEQISILRTGCLVLLVTTFLLAMLCIYFAIKINGMAPKVSEDEQNVEILYTQEQVDELVLSASENAARKGDEDFREYVKYCVTEKVGTSEMLRQLFPEYIVYPGGGSYIFAEISKDIPANEIDDADFRTMDNGIKVYEPDGVSASKVCIDVSQHNGTIDWNKVAESGLVDYVMVRVGFRGYGSGKLVLDEQFENNVKGAISVGLPVGVYFFSQAVSESEIEEEFDFVMQAIAPYNVTGPIAIDIERVDDSEARGNLISKEERTHLVDMFCKMVSEKNYSPMLYGNTYSIFEMLDMKQLSSYDVWYAFYESYLYYPYIVKMWQYSAAFNIPGIDEKVDMNIMFE